jgi:hypothetical protein
VPPNTWIKRRSLNARKPPFRDIPNLSQNWREPPSRSGSYFQTAQAKLIHCLRARLGFILGVDGDLRRQAAELITDVPAVIAAFRAAVPVWCQ